MGQVMYKHEYPDYGNGDTSYTDGGSHYISVDYDDNEYRWWQMTDNFLTQQNHNGPELLFECGASVGMDYDCSGSSATTSDVVYALIHRFNYAATAKYIEKDDYSDTEWKNTLKNELDEGRPMVYRAQDGLSGHAWVCEGYNYDYFYMNWGWYGEDNAYYTLDGLEPPENGGEWEEDQACIVSIQPPVYSSLPYSTGFESGLDDAWAIQSSTKYGRIQITSNYSPHSGNKHLTMDVNTNNHYNTNFALLHLDLASYSEADLSFWWKEFSEETDQTDGVYFSDDGGKSYTKVFSLSGNNGSWEHEELDIDELASSYNLDLTSTFVIKFQQYDNYTISSDGFAFDDIEISEPPPPTYPDLRILSQNVTPYTVSPGSNVTASCYVKNQGDGVAGSSYLKYYLSSNWTYSGDDVYLGYDYVGSLQPDASSYESALLTIPSETEENIYYILFYADANHTVEESNENNNVGFFRINVMELGMRTAIYPNPADDHFFIELPVNEASATITIVDIEGKPVKEIIAEEKIIKINTKDILSGQYILQISILNEEYSKMIQIIH